MAHYINREISWLAFNERVLREAESFRHPPMERLRYIAIADNNLDEFLIVRVAGIVGQLNAGVEKLTIDGLTVQKQLSYVMKRIKKLLYLQYQIYNDTLQFLSSYGYNIIDTNTLQNHDIKNLYTYFKHHIFPALTSLTIDPAHPFPFIPNDSFILVFALQHPHNAHHKRHAIVLIPKNLKRFIRLSWHKKYILYIACEEVIALFYQELFVGFTCCHYGTIRIMRDSNVEYYEESEDLVRHYKNLLRQRQKGRIIYVAYNGKIDKEFLALLEQETDILSKKFFYIKHMLALRDLQQIVDEAHIEHKYTPIIPRWPTCLQNGDYDCFKAIKEQDFLVHHPYEDFKIVVHFIEQASLDPQVVTIKQTLYRTSDDSPIIKALIKAAEQGKSVTALVELKARFDEEANIKWAENLEKAGVNVVYGFVQLKTHAKITLIIRREDQELCTYMHFGTGNYHPVNAKTYTDLSYFTANKILAHDASTIFNYMTGYAEPKKIQHIIVSPFNLRTMLHDHIDKQIAYKKQNKPAWMIFKVNNIIDKSIIDHLYQASQEGVRIDLIVRGICALRPQIASLSDHIYVRSIIGRFLEHSRIYAFADSDHHINNNAHIYIGSADLMSRNLDRRFEVMLPISDTRIKKHIMNDILQKMLLDEQNCWLMDQKGDYHRHPNAEKADSFSCHHYFLTHHTLSSTGDYHA